MLIPRQVSLVDGLKIDYVERGRSGMPVLLLPGLGDTWRSFEPVLAGLPATIRLFALSQRGHGDSDRPLSGYLPSDYARDAVAFLDAVGVGRAVLVGHSSSTFTARLVALAHPARVAGLVLIGSPLTLVGNLAATELARSTLDPLVDPVTEDFVRAFVAPTVGAAVPEDFLEAMVTESAKTPARVWRQTFDGLLAHDGANGLDRIAAPTLLVWGDADAIVPRPDQGALIAAIHSSRLLVYPGVGHSPHWERPTQFAADLAAFVDEVSSGDSRSRA